MCTPESKNNGNDNISCHIMEGKLTLFYSHSLDNDVSRRKRHLMETIRQSEEKKMRHSIKAIMDKGALNDCHPAIINVKFRNQTNVYVYNSNDDDFNIANDDTIITVIESQPSIWLALGASISLLGFLVMTRYRYHRHQKDVDKDQQYDTGSSSSDDAFIEFGGPDDDFDLASSLSLSSPISKLQHSEESRSSQSYKKRSTIRSTSFSSKGLESSESGIASDPPQQDPPSQNPPPPDPPQQDPPSQGSQESNIDQSEESKGQQLMASFRNEVRNNKQRIRLIVFIFFN